VELPAGAWVVFLLSSWLGIALAHGLYYIAVQRIGAAIGSIMLTTAPLISLLGSHVMFGEEFTVLQWIGGLVLLGGAILAVRTQAYLKPYRGPAADGAAH
jgi:drug/metabolite transporter (DMT)-like permease